MIIIIMIIIIVIITGIYQISIRYVSGANLRFDFFFFSLRLDFYTIFNCLILYKPVRLSTYIIPML